MDPGYLGMPLLTFHYVAALVVGYFAGYFILMGTVNPDRSWQRSRGSFNLVQKGFAWVLIVATFGVPVALAYRNYPAIRHENGPVLANLVNQWTESLPEEPSLLLVEDNFSYTLLTAWRARSQDPVEHLVFYSRSGVEKSYRKQLADRHAGTWPELKSIAESEVNVAGHFLAMVLRTAREQRAFNLTIPNNFMGEYFAMDPHGALFRLRAFAPGEITPRSLNSEQAADIVKWWESRSPFFESLNQGFTLETPSSMAVGKILSRSANLQGLRLQQSGQYPEAAQLFRYATNFSRENLPARVNLTVNQRLQSGEPIQTADRKDLESVPLSRLIDLYGPVDEPVTLKLLGESALQRKEPLARSAAVAFQRVLELDPNHMDAAIGYAQAAASAGELELTRNAITRVRTMGEATPLNAEQQGRLVRVEAAATVGGGEVTQAQISLAEAYDANPEDLATLDLLIHLHQRSGTLTNVLPHIEKAIQLKPGQQPIRERFGLVLLKTGNTAKADEVFTHIIERNSTHAPSRVNRGTARLLKGDLDGAKIDFQWLLDQDRQVIRARIGLATLAEAQGNLDEARRQVERALEKTAPRSMVYTNLVLHLERLKGGQPGILSPVTNPPPELMDQLDVREPTQ
jgi:Tfp pilus assembly protein PilF